MSTALIIGLPMFPSHIFLKCSHMMTRLRNILRETVKNQQSPRIELRASENIPKQIGRAHV